MLSHGIILLHDNALPYTAKPVRDKLQRFGWETLQHPPYSPDLSLSDFHIFGELKKDIVHRCGPGGSMRASYVAGPGLIPGRGRFPG